LVSLNGRSRDVDVARVDRRTFSLIVSTPSGTDTAPDAGRIGSSYEVTISPDAATGQLIVHVDGMPVTLTLNGRRWGRRDHATTSGSGPERIAAPMPGKIIRILVQTGESVRARQPVIVVEAMKMENELRASRDGTVAEIHVREGMSVDAGTLLVVLQ
jgi:biotin carboxyl carrier protein